MKEIFIGSSTPAIPQAIHVAKILSRVKGVKPLLWNRCFPTGVLTFEHIEFISRGVAGAVMLATPDDPVITASQQKILLPRSNVMIEYGLLSGVLGRERVFLCAYDGATLPSDLHGITAPKMGDSYVRNPGAQIQPEVKNEILRWVKTLPQVATGISSSELVHGYSGMWNAQFTFKRYRGKDLSPEDRISGHSDFLLYIPRSGEKGYGFEKGTIHVTTRACKATIAFTLELKDIRCSADGKVTIRCTAENIPRFIVPDIGEIEEGWKDSIHSVTSIRYELSPHLKDPRSLVGAYYDYDGDAENIRTYATLEMTKAD